MLLGEWIANLAVLAGEDFWSQLPIDAIIVMGMISQHSGTEALLDSRSDRFGKYPLQLNLRRSLVALAWQTSTSVACDRQSSDLSHHPLRTIRR